MDKKFVQKSTMNDDVYKGLWLYAIDDHYDNPYLNYLNFLNDSLDSLREGKMPLDVYNNFLEKGVTKVLQEMKQKDNNSQLLRKIQDENPELLK